MGARIAPSIAVSGASVGTGLNVRGVGPFTSTAFTGAHSFGRTVMVETLCIVGTIIVIGTFDRRAIGTQGNAWLFDALCFGRATNLFRLKITAGGVSRGAGVGAVIKTAIEAIAFGGTFTFIGHILGAAIGHLLFTINFGGAGCGARGARFDAVCFAIFLGTGVIGAAANTRT